jgi:glycine cleavage system H lipoate-binding protein
MKTKATQRKRREVKVFSIEEDQCIWMKAGVVNFKLCENAYDCLSCAFDKAMIRTVSRKPEEGVTWQEARKLQPYKQKECRHMLTGRVEYHFCSNAYRCNVCEFDQVLEEGDLARLEGNVHLKKVAGFQMADSYYYHRGHSWARVEHGGLVRIGIDDFALKLLGPPNDVLLPKLGSHVEQTEIGWTIRREEKTADVLAPMSGVVVATNHKIRKMPHLAKEDPYGRGWLVVLEPRGLKQNLRNLLFEQESAAWFSSEAEKLEAMITDTYGIQLAATGGEMVDDIYANVSSLISWDDLVHEFLLT